MASKSRGVSVRPAAVPLMAWLVASAVANQPVGFRRCRGPSDGLLVAAVVLSLASWLIRLIVSPAVLVRPGPASRRRGQGDRPVNYPRKEGGKG